MNISGVSTIHQFFLIFFIASVAFSLAGCRRAGSRDDRERNKRFLAKAYEQLDKAEYASAEVLFKRAVDAHPTLARPHLDLAFLLHDRRSDFLRAVYHYQRYLELRPDTDKRDMIAERIAQAERLFVARQMIADAVEGRSVQDLLNENRMLRAQFSDLQKKTVSLEQELAVIRDADRRRVLQEVSGEVTRDKLQVPSAGTIQEVPERPQIPEPRYPASPSAPFTTATGEEPAGIEKETSGNIDQEHPEPDHDVRQTYTVREGDSLSKIAYKVYGDASKWRVIQEANQAVLGGSVNVRVGQTLEIPKGD